MIGKEWKEFESKEEGARFKVRLQGVEQAHRYHSSSNDEKDGEVDVIEGSDVSSELLLMLDNSKRQV